MTEHLQPSDSGSFSDLSHSSIEVRPDLPDVLRSTWDDLASPGTWWDGQERVAIAAASRSARAGDAPSGELPPPVSDAARVVAASPWDADERWVRTTIDLIGERRYVELVGVASSVVAVDTITALLGRGVERLPEPRTGDAVPDGDIPDLKRRSSWVAMVGPPGPRRALTAVPQTQQSINRLLGWISVPEEGRTSKLGAPGLTRMQVEVVLLAASHANACFWCVLSHGTALRRAGDRSGASIDFAAIIDPSVDLGVPGGAELVALSRGGVVPDPDPSLVAAVAQLVGDEGAQSAVELLGAIQVANRLTEVTGHAVPKRRLDEGLAMLETLGALDFPNSGVTVVDGGPSTARRALSKLKRRFG